MALYRSSAISIESWVDMTQDVPIRHEIDHLNRSATLAFGDDDFVLVLNEANLGQVIDLATRAQADLQSPQLTPSGTR